jgi:hypothetical protein
MRYNGDYYIPQAIDIQDKTRKDYDGRIFNFKQVEGNYTICNLGIINTLTGDLLPNAEINNGFDGSYFYAFFKYSVKVNNYAICIYENATGLLVKKFYLRLE